MIAIRLCPTEMRCATISRAPRQFWIVSESISFPLDTEHNNTTGMVLGRFNSDSASRSGDITTTPSARPRIARIAVSMPCLSAYALEIRR